MKPRRADPMAALRQERDGIDRVIELERLLADAVAAQAMVLPIPRVEFELVEELSDTQRGAGGFGSTGQGGSA